jgi:ABC-2 type transport system ATP-binding protein
MAPVIELDGLEVRFGTRSVLKRLKGELHGRCIGLLGPNGSGKSTLLNTLLGFYPPAQGTARIFGKDIGIHSRELRGLIGYMPESDAFISNLTGVHFVRYMAELSGLPSTQALERAHEALFYVGLGEVRYRKLGTYSLGMKQLAKLAQAIAHGPKLVFLDEPTNGLDPPARTRMIQLIQEIRDAGDMHVVISSHLLRDVDECCDEVIILRDGNIAGICNIEEERRMNRKFLELETHGEDREGRSFADAVQQLGCECALFGKGRMKVVLPESIEIRALYQIAAQRDVQIRRMNYRRDSLEDIFLKAMEQVGTRNGSL